jgi:hypothetical protein
MHRDGDRLPFFCFGVRNSEQQHREIWHKHLSSWSDVLMASLITGHHVNKGNP